MIPRDMILQVLGRMSDADLLQALAAVKGGAGGAPQANSVGEKDIGYMLGQESPALAGADYEETRDGVQGWGKRTIARAPDDRPELADKKYLVPKELVQHQLPGGLPVGGDPGGYDAPGGQ